MVGRIAVLVFSGAAVVSQALMKSAPLDREAGPGAAVVDRDEVNLLQSSVIAEESKQPADLRLAPIEALAPIFDRDEDAEFGSMLSEDYVHCIEGSTEDESYLSGLIRASPLNSLYHSQWFVRGATCESRGYTEQLQLVDECWESFSRWIRPGVPMERANYGTAGGGLWVDVLDLYDQDHGYPAGTSREWVACAICTPNSQVRTGGAFGQEYNCDDESFLTITGPRILANMRSATAPDGDSISRGSIIPDNELVCFEGSLETLEIYLEAARRTPLGALFANSVVSGHNCQERGFDSTRDLIDECWPDTAFIMREETESQDIGDWIMSYISVMHNYDSSELSGGRWNTYDWVACKACFPGGAVRGRGLWTTMHGGDSLPYTEAFCRAARFPDGVP